MPNPIIESLNRSQKRSNNLFDDMMRSNPQFRDFVQKNQGKSPEQIAKDYGLNPNLLKNLIR